MRYDITMTGDNASADFFTIFGESPNSLELALRGNVPIEFITVMDEALINITDLYYDAGVGAFFVVVENYGSVAAFVDVEIQSIWVNGQRVTVGGDEAILVEPGSKGKIRASIELADEDIAHSSNQQVSVKVLYGERENSLIKELDAIFEFKMKKADFTYYVLIIVVVVLFLILLLAKRRKKKKKHHYHHEDL